MQAIILAAGMGKRLGELTQSNTKCMIKLNGVRLIDRMLLQLSSLNLRKIILVIGYQGEQLRKHVLSTYPSLNIEFIENPIFDKTNNIYSLSLAKDALIEDDTLLIESDLVFDDSLFAKILNHPYPNLAMVAKYEPWMDGTMVRLDEEGNIINFVPKKAFKFSDVDSYYKTVNIYKFSRTFLLTHYVPFLDAYTKALGNNEYYEQVLRVITLLDNCDLKALPLAENEKWYEIDDVQDLDIAEALFSTGKEKLAAYQKRYGGYWRFPKLLDFCYLVNPYFPPQKMRDEIKANFDILLTEYPSGMQVNSLLAGKYFGIKKEWICVGNGAAELIKALMESFVHKIGIVYPTFEEYPNRSAYEKIVPFVPSNDDFSYTVDDLISFFEGKDIDSLLLINPDNPTGNFIPIRDLFHLLDWASIHHIRVIIDESFVDFSEEGTANSLMQNDILDNYHNLLLVKSISKSYGVPGLRLGVLASSDVSLINALKKNVAIWNINSFAEFYMQIFAKYQSDYQKSCSLFRAERKRFKERLHQIDFLRVIPSQANYFLCELLHTYSSEQLAEKLLVDYNILIKDCSKKIGFGKKEYIRIAVRNREDNDFLVEVLENL